MLKKILLLLIPLMFIITQSTASWASDAEVVLKTLMQKGVISKMEYRKIKRDLGDTERLEQRVEDIEARSQATGTNKLEKRLSAIESKTESLSTEELEQRVTAIENSSNKTAIPDELKKRINKIEKQTGYIAESAESNAQLIAQVDNKISATSKSNSTDPVPAWSERITFTGAIEGDITYIDKSDFRDTTSDSASNLFISTVEMGLEALITESLTGSALFLAEDIGTADENGVVIDEALLSFQLNGSPLYAVFGKSAKPFGVYENHLISDPMTQEGYETNAPGLTVGITGPMDLDASITVYKGDGMMAHLFESGLFETDDTAAEFLTRPATTDDDISSYILSGSITPVPDQLTLFASFLSEKGHDERNNSVALGIDYNSGTVEGLIVDVEYIMAAQRDPYTSDGGVTGEFKEKVLSATVAFVIGGGERGEPGTTYEERRAHIFAEPLELALRYEHFDDDGLEEETQTWSVDKRFSVGARYSVYEDEALGVAAFAALEYRRTSYRISSALAGVAEDSSNEILSKFGVSF